MVRAVTILMALAMLANAQCSGACLINDLNAQSGACHHNQKKSVERCDHRLLIADDWTASQLSPLFAATLVSPEPPLRLVFSSDSAPTPLSPSPPLISSSITILKI